MSNKKPVPQIALNWRDENYGNIAAVAAFRNYAGTSDWSQAAHARFNSCLRRTGFKFDWSRHSYIAKVGTGPECKLALCEALGCAGFDITEGDVRVLA